LIIATDLHPSRLRLAEAFGASLTLCVGETDQEERVARVRDATSGRGADIVLSCSGIPAAFTEALKMVRVGGVVVEAGAFVDMGPVQLNPNSDICTRNVSIIGIGGETATSYLSSMRLMAANLDRLPFDRFVTHRLPINRAQEGVELAQTDAAMKVVIAPHLAE
jgi:L-iditol 2-dehydrogenase